MIKYVPLIWFITLLVAPLASAEMDGRFLYISKSEGTTEYVLSDGPVGESDIKTKNIDKVVKAIGQLGATGSSNYVAIKTRGGVKTSDLLPIFTAIEKNPYWELVVLEKGGGTIANIVGHHLDKNDPNRELRRAQQDAAPSP